MPKKIKYPPLGRNGQKTDYLYFQRGMYYDDPFDDLFPQGADIPTLVDTWYDKTLYGKVDTFGRYVFPDDDYIYGIRNGVEVMDFVADAYEDLVSFVTLAATQIKTSMTSVIDIQDPQKGHFDLVEEYGRYMEKLNDSFINGFLSPKQRNNITSFSQYYTHYLAYAEMNLVQPYTLAGYLASNRTRNACSGLIIEFGSHDGRYGNDSYKWEEFLRKDFFDDYLKITAKFGFYVDRNIPWAIVANLGSHQMQEYLYNNGSTSLEGFFSDKYFQAEYMSYLYFKQQMYNSYLNFLIQQPLVEKVHILNCPQTNILTSKFKTSRTIEERQNEFVWLPNATFEQFENFYPERYFVRKYFDLRLLENKIFLSPRHYNTKLDKLIQLVTTQGLYEALEALGGYLQHETSRKNSLTFKEKRNNIKSKRKDIQPSGY